MNLSRSVFRRNWEPKPYKWGRKMRNPHVDEAHTSIIRSLRDMFKQAKDEKLWFYNSYQRLWLSPSKLRATMESGSYIWGPSNWTLRDPSKYGQTT